MPDWISHILFAIILIEIFSIKRKSLVILGALLPDMIIKFELLSLILPIDKYFINSFLLPFHTPIGMFLFTILLVPFFNFDHYKTYLSLFIGWSSHLMLDTTNKHMIIGENQLFFPFSWKNFEFSLFWPNQYYYIILILIFVLIAILLIKVIKDKRLFYVYMGKILFFLGKLIFMFKRRTISLDNINKILVIRSGAMGDVLMTTPFIKSVRKNFPKSKISYLVGDWSASVLKNNPNIDEILTFEDKIIFKKEIVNVIKVIKEIRKKRFDIVFILDKSYQWNLFAFFCDINSRVGFDRCGEGFSNNINVWFDGTMYELDYNLQLLSTIRLKIFSRDMELFPSKKDAVISARLSKKIKGKLIGISPGAAKNIGQEMAIKRWPKENYLELIKKLLAKNSNIKIVLFGGSDDKIIGDFIESNLKNKNLINLIGKTNIQQSYLIMKKCKLFITHDSGPMHIAAASGTKMIALFGPTPPNRFAPKNAFVFYKGNPKKPGYNVYGRFIDEKLMEKISVDEVYTKVKEII